VPVIWDRLGGIRAAARGRAGAENALLSDAVAAVAGFAAARRVTLTSRPPKQPITVETDAPKLRQAVASLVTAAIRLADQGAVALSARSDDAAVVIEVRAPTTAHAARGLSRIFESTPADLRRPARHGETMRRSTTPQRGASTAERGWRSRSRGVSPCTSAEP
jgi:hypothetical protein